ncbi:MAG: histidine kinase, partial [Lachnospiraceae bacterium]|nr:histidine kinase [Lachnospiraceae bacterium]
MSEGQEIMPAPLVGQYELDGNGEMIPFDNLKSIDIGEASSVRVVGHFTEDIPVGHRVFLYMYRELIKVYVNGEVVFDNADDYRPRWDFFGSNGVKTTDLIDITISKVPGEEYYGAVEDSLHKLCVGTRYGLVSNRVKANVGSITVCLILFTFAIGELMVASVLITTRRSEARGSVSCSLVLMFGSFCCFIDYDYITLFMGNYKAIGVVDIVNQALLILFFLENMFIHMRKKLYSRISQLVMAIWCAAIAVFAIVGITGTHGNTILGIGILCVIAIVSIILDAVLEYMDCQDYYEKVGKYNGEMVSNIILAGFTVVELGHYMFAHNFLINVFELGISIYGIMQFVMLLYRTVEFAQKARQSDILGKQLIENQMSIMLSQIQPHFLYNSLTAIQILCVRDPKAAQKALGDFALYLRGNMDSLKSNKLIPFEKELEHTKHYVELELIRQGEYLQVEYDIQYTDFELPALSLQPIVENAIKHGVGDKEDGGKVLISVQRRYDDVLIVVDDDGVGFEGAGVTEDGRSHIGLENVRRRLSDMCGATLDIKSKPGVGTQVTIT